MCISKKIASKSLLTIVMAILLGISQNSYAQAEIKYPAGDNINLILNGTSTLHDWDMKSAKGKVEAVFTFDKNGHISGLTALVFATPAEGLKSDHSAMDRNAYKALKTSGNPNISFSFVSANVTTTDGVNYMLRCQGKLTIAGTTVNTDLVATAKLNADKSITVSGSKKISMKDFNVEPPTFMFGTIKTGNDVTLKFSLNLKQ